MGQTLIKKLLFNDFFLGNLNSFVSSNFQGSMPKRPDCMWLCVSVTVAP